MLWLFSIENNGKGFMKDHLNREINYMRISLTDRCNYACYYCKPEIETHLSHFDIVSYEQILDICRCAIHLGITRFKITGGEPTIRKGYIEFIRRLKTLEGVQQVTLTTNGSLLSYADLDELKEVGIDGINCSIDTLDLNEYTKICQKNSLSKVLDNMNYAYFIGIKVKVNCVVDNTFTLSRFESMLTLIKDKKIALRFIELMPLKYSEKNNKMNEFIQYIQTNYSIQKYAHCLGNGPATYYTIEGYSGYIGFIEALHHKFCSTCNRVRLSSIGRLKLCLFHTDGVDLKPYLKDVHQLERVMEYWIYQKPKEHHFEEENSMTIMNQIGG